MTDYHNARWKPETNFLFVLFCSILFYSMLVCYQPHSTTGTVCIFRYFLITRTLVVIETNCEIRNKKTLELPDFFNYSPICPHNFSFQTLSLYFLFDMSYNSSHLRTNSINFSSISEDKNRQHSLQTLEVQWRRRKTSHYRNRAGTDRSGPVPSRQTFSLSNDDGTEL